MADEGARKALWALLIVLVLVLAVLAYLVATGSFRPAVPPGAGAATLDYLRADPYPNMVLEFDYVSGAEPASESTNLLRQRIVQYTEKVSVVVRLDDALAPGDGSYTIEEIADLEGQNRDLRTEGDTAVLYFLYLDGVFEDPSLEGAENTLAVTYTASTVAVFKERIASLALPSIGPFQAEVTTTDIENSVVVHELGHVFGLVNLVYASDLDYEDPSHPGHSSNESDVMYWAVEGVGIGDLISGRAEPPPTDFASETRYDLAKLREGGYELRLVTSPPFSPMAAPSETAARVLR
jgi:hypothetical protein